MARGVFWTFLEKFGQQFIFITIFAFLTHLIGPEEFGLYSLCYVVVSFSMMIIYGAVDSIIMNKNEDEENLSTLFWTIFGVGVVLSATTFACSGFFARVMKDDRLFDLLRWLSVLPMLTSVTAIPSGLVQIRMDFRVFTIRSLVSAFLSGIFGVILAWRGAGAYSMIGQQIAQQTIDNLIIWPSVNWTPRFIFRPDRVWSLLSPGFKMMGSTVLNFFEMNTARLLIGASLGPIEVGYFSFVNRLWIVLREVLALPITTVLLPALVHTENDATETKKLVKQITFFSGMIIFPAVAGIMATAPQFIPLFFGDKWIKAIPIMQVFLIASAMAPFMFILRDVLRARRRTEVYFFLQLALFAANFAIMLILVKSGVIPMCWGLVAVALVSFPISVFVVARKSGLALAQAFMPMGLSLVSSVLMYAAIYGVEYCEFYPANPWLHLFSSIMVGGVTYIGLSVLLQYRQILKGWEAFSAMLASTRRRKGDIPVDRGDETINI